MDVVVAARVWLERTVPALFTSTTERPVARVAGSGWVASVATMPSALSAAVTTGATNGGVKGGGGAEPPITLATHDWIEETRA